MAGTFIPSDYAESVRRDVVLAPPTCCCCCCCCSTLVVPEMLFASKWVRDLDREHALRVPATRATRADAFVTALGGASVGFMVGFLPAIPIGFVLVFATGGTSLLLTLVAFAVALVILFIRVGREHSPPGESATGGVLGFFMGLVASAFLLMSPFLVFIPAVIVAVLARRRIRQAREARKRGPPPLLPTPSGPTPVFTPYGSAPPRNPPYPPR